MPSQPVAPWIEQVLLDIFRTCTYPTPEGDELHDILKAKLILSKAIAAHAPKPSVAKLVEAAKDASVILTVVRDEGIRISRLERTLKELVAALAAYDKETQ